jgi:hypothetical protein|tara:strand:- start:7927 stop:8376 length:450 start_codon:yes stop_codon:yes gene_type:complete
MTINNDNEKQDDEQPQAAVDLEVALKQMNDDGMPPTGFHMMFFSEDFKMSDDCPMNQLLRKIGYTYDFHDTIKRQVFQMPKSTIITYEFAWLGGFDGIQSTLETIDTLLKGQFDKMVEDKVLRKFPQARVSFLTNETPLETEDEDNDLF